MLLLAGANNLCLDYTDEKILNDTALLRVEQSDSDSSSPLRARHIAPPASLFARRLSMCPSP